MPGARRRPRPRLARCRSIVHSSRRSSTRRSGKLIWKRKGRPRLSHCHGWACPGHPRLSSDVPGKTWMPGTRPGMTSSVWRVIVTRTDTMADIRVPTLGESVTEATIGKWFKKPGEPVAVDEPLVELETDKVTIEVPAPAAGVLADIAVKDGETVAVGALLGQITEGAAPSKTVAAPAGRPDQKTTTTAPINVAEEEPKLRTPETPPARPASDMPAPPSVRKMAAESGIATATVPGSGKDGRVTKGDMMAAIERAAAQPTPVSQPAASVQVRA